MFNQILYVDLSYKNTKTNHVNRNIMSKEDFYKERKALFLKEFEEFKKTKTARDSVKAVAAKNNVTEGLAMAVIYNPTYNQKSKLPENQETT